jgi:hypothetical protein
MCQPMVPLQNVKLKKNRDHRNLRRQLKIQTVIFFLAFNTKIIRV